MASIQIPAPLRPYAGNQSRIVVEGATVGAALDDLTDQYPALKQHLFDGRELRPFVNIYLHKEDVRYLQGNATPVQPKDALLIVPSVAGG